MFRFRYLALAFSLTATLTLPSVAAADPVQITGFMQLGGHPEVMSRGFMRQIFYDLTIDDVRVRWGDGDYDPQRPLSPSIPRPSNWLSLDGSTLGMAFFDFAGLSITATPSAAPSPFSAAGFFRIVDENGTILFNDNVFGAGTATWGFLPLPEGGNVVYTVRYDFSDAAPTPEPTTLLLIGSGLAGAVLRRRLHP